MSSPSFSIPPSPLRADCPSRAPEHPAGLLIYPVLNLPVLKGSEFIFHSNSVRQVGISPFSKWGYRLREV